MFIVCFCMQFKNHFPSRPFIFLQNSTKNNHWPKTAKQRNTLMASENITKDLIDSQTPRFEPSKIVQKFKFEVQMGFGWENGSYCIRSNKNSNQVSIVLKANGSGSCCLRLLAKSECARQSVFVWLLHKITQWTQMANPLAGSMIRPTTTTTTTSTNATALSKRPMQVGSTIIVACFAFCLLLISCDDGLVCRFVLLVFAFNIGQFCLASRIKLCVCAIPLKRIKLQWNCNRNCYCCLQIVVWKLAACKRNCNCNWIGTFA